MADKAAKGRQALGERNPGAKLTQADVLSIRLHAAALVPQWVSAALFGISIDQVSNIARRRNWAHVA